jgi:hypothetical protein
VLQVVSDRGAAGGRHSRGDQSPGVRGKLTKWVTTTISEMYIFLVTVLLMGIVKKNSLREYWSTDPMFATPFFASFPKTAS